MVYFYKRLSVSIAVANQKQHACSLFAYMQSPSFAKVKPTFAPFNRAQYFRPGKTSVN